MLSLLLLASVLVEAGVLGSGSKSVPATLRFARKRHAKPDTWVEFRGLDALLRWDREPNTTEHDLINMEELVVEAKDASARSDFTVSTTGFERIDLHPRLLPLLKEIKARGLSGNRVGPTTGGGSIFVGGGTDETVEDRLARELQGSESFSLGGDTVHWAFRCAGFVIRKGGPEAAKLEGAGFDNVAMRVHIDQDLEGEPVLGMGMAWIFKLPFMRLLNVWSPLHDVRMRPLVFADVRTVSRVDHVLRYRTNSTLNAGGRFGSFRSDRLMPLFAPEHEWWWYPDTRFGQAIAFDTGSVPHSSFSLPGEAVLGTLRNDLQDIVSHGSSSSACSRVGSHVRPDGLSIDMEAYIGSAEAFVRRACAGRASPDDLANMLEYITRASLEIRCVTLILPRTAAKAGAATALAVFATLSGLIWSRRRRHASLLS